MGTSNIAVLPAKLQSKFDNSRRRFTFWNEAEDAGFRTKNQWRRKEKRGIRGKATGVIWCKDRDILLYHKSQTTKLTERSLAAYRLLDRFVTRSDILGYQPYRTDDWLQISEYPWHFNELVKKGWNHAVCHERGIRLTRDERRKPGIMAQSFSVRCGPRTDFFVIDLDNHVPTAANISIHLELVGLIQKELPELVEALGGGSTFYQYRQIDPTGIQFWATLNWKMSVLGLPKRAGRRAEPGLHEQIRKFLVGLEKKSPGLNERLNAAGLATLDRIEILPTQSSQISIPGCYGKTLFTTKELKLVDGRVDVLALENHIRDCVTGGNVLPRYKALVEACWGNDSRSCGAGVLSMESSDILAMPPSSAISTSAGWPESADLIIPLDVSSKDGRRYWTDLTRKALNGVTSSDALYEEYLQPLAQCLFFRDFVHCPNREELVEEELFAWVTAKHNGNVSRILAGEERAVRSQCRQVAKKVEATTCKAVKSYYQSILANDLIYPHRVEHLCDFMRAGSGSGSRAEWNTSSLIHWKCSISPPDEDSKPADTQDRPFNDQPLHPTISQRVMEAAEDVRQGAVRERFLIFATRFLNEIASNHGERDIPWRRINAMMGKPDLQGRQTQVRYKEKLVHAGLIKRDWQKFIRRNARSSKYRLTDWAYEQLREGDATSQAKSA